MRLQEEVVVVGAEVFPAAVGDANVLVEPGVRSEVGYSTLRCHLGSNFLLSANTQNRKNSNSKGKSLGSHSNPLILKGWFRRKDSDPRVRKSLITIVLFTEKWPC
jgi:hypothetical protein